MPDEGKLTISIIALTPWNTASNINVNVCLLRLHAVTTGPN